MAVSSTHVTQQEIDQLLQIGDLIAEQDSGKLSLADEIRDAILDSGKLTLEEWQSLRQRLHEIEDLIPHINFIVELKTQQKKKAAA